MFTIIAIGTALFSLSEAWCLINGAQRVTRELRREGAHAVLRQVRVRNVCHAETGLIR